MAVRPRLHSDLLEMQDFPDASVFVDVRLTSRSGVEVTNRGDVETALHTVDTIVEELAASVHARVSDGELQHT